MGERLFEDSSLIIAGSIHQLGNPSPTSWHLNEHDFPKPHYFYSLENSEHSCRIRHVDP